MSTKKIENIKTSFFVSIEQIEEMGKVKHFNYKYWSKLIEKVKK